MSADRRAQLADLIAEKLLRNRTVPVRTVQVQVTPDREDAAPTVLLIIATEEGQRITATLNDDPSD